MSSFELTDEKAIDVLIFYIIGADGSIDYEETEAVDRVLEDLDYDPQEYYHDTLLHINGLSTEHTNDLIDDATKWVCKNFDKEKRKLIFVLLESLASTDGEINKSEQEKLDKLKKYFQEKNC